MCHSYPLTVLFYIVKFYSENRAKLGTVCVANHTTPIDIIMLAQDNCFTLVSSFL